MKSKSLIDKYFTIICVFIYTFALPLQLINMLVLPNYKRCSADDVTESYLSSSCTYFLVELQLEEILEKKIKETNSNRLRQAYLARVKDNLNPNFIVNVKKRKILEECYLNNGCLYTYIEAHTIGSFGTSIDIEKVNTARQKIILNSINEKNTNSFISSLVDYKEFLHVHPDISPEFFNKNIQLFLREPFLINSVNYKDNLYSSDIEYLKKQ